MNSLTLLEQFVLLSIDDERGHYAIGSIQLNYGVVAAALIELALQEKISLNGEEITVNTARRVKDPALAIIAHELEKSTKSMSLKNWLQKLQRQTDSVLTATVNRLVDADILEIKKGKILWIIPTTKYPTENPMAERRLKQRIREIVLDKRKASANELMLLSLVSTCGLVSEIFPRDQRRDALEIIEALTESSQVAQELGETIRMIQTVITTNAAIMSAITTTVITN